MIEAAQLSKARSLGKKIISEDELLALVKASAGGAAAPAPKMQAVPAPLPRKKESPAKTASPAREQPVTARGKQPTSASTQPPRTEVAASLFSPKQQTELTGLRGWTCLPRGGAGPGAVGGQAQADEDGRPVWQWGQSQAAEDVVKLLGQARGGVGRFVRGRRQAQG